MAPARRAGDGSMPGAEALSSDMTRDPVGWDVDSPIQAEVFVVWLDGDRIQLTGPDGPQPWLLQLRLPADATTTFGFTLPGPDWNVSNFPLSLNELVVRLVAVKASFAASCPAIY